MQLISLFGYVLGVNTERGKCIRVCESVCTRVLRSLWKTRLFLAMIEAKVEV